MGTDHRLMVLLSLFLVLSALGCATQRVITTGVAEGSLVWFGEVFISGGSSDTNIIVCHRSGIPACMRVPIRDASKQYAEWRETALENDATLYPHDRTPAAPTSPNAPRTEAPEHSAPAD